MEGTHQSQALNRPYKADSENTAGRFPNPVFCGGWNFNPLGKAKKQRCQGSKGRAMPINFTRKDYLQWNELLLLIKPESH